MEMEKQGAKPTFNLTAPNFLISLNEHLLPFLCLSSHWFRKITESVGIGQIEGLFGTEMKESGLCRGQNVDIKKFDPVSKCMSYQCLLQRKMSG